MKTIFLFLTALFATSLVNGQYVDSLEVFELDGNIHVEIEGRNPSTGEYISDIETEVVDSEINIDLYFIRCAGLTVITPYDTTVNLGSLPPEEYLITCRSLLDINLDSTMCAANYEISPIDSLSINYIVLGVEDEELPRNEIRVYPNPFSDFIIVEVENVKEDYSLVITDLNGKIIKHFQSVSSRQRVDLSFMKQGAYIAIVKTPDGQETSRRIIKLGK